MAEVVLRIAGDNVSAIRSVREFVQSLQDVRVEEGRVATASKEASLTVAESAAKNVRSATEQIDALRELIGEYGKMEEVYAADVRGQDAATAATKLRIKAEADLAAALDVSTKAQQRSADAAVASAGKSAVSAEESGVARGIASRTIGVGAFAGGAFIGGAIAGIAIKKAADEAQRAQESQAQLENALKRTGISWHANADEIDRYLVKAEAASSFDRIDLRTGLSELVRATGNVTQSQKLLTTATDVARGRHIDLEAAIRLVTRAYQGNVGALRRVGIDVQAVTTAQDKLHAANVKVTPEMLRQAKAIDTNKTSLEALRVLNERYSGAAEAHAHTLAGREEALSNAFTDVSVQIGKAATPALVGLFTWMTKEIEAAQHSKTVHEVLHDTLATIGFVLRDVVLPVVKLSIELFRLEFEAIGKVVDVVRNDLIPAFKDFFGFIQRVGRAAWEAVIQTAKSAVYIILTAATSAIRGILEVASHLPFVGDKARAALNSINDYLDKWKPDFSKVDAAFRQGGSDAGKAFVDAATLRMSQGHYVNPSLGAAIGSAVQGGRFKGGGSSIQTGLVSTGLTAVGNPYKYGGAPSLSSPTDCSGLMVAIFAKHGISLPRTSQEQYSQAPIKNARPLAVGDLVFAEGVHPGHVGLYIGKGQVLQDPHTGASVDVIPLNSFGWNGESARWWGGKKSSGSGSGGAGAGAGQGPMGKTPSIDSVIASGTPKPKPAAPAYHGPTGDALIPAGLRNAVAAVAQRARKLLAAGAATSDGQAADYYAQAASVMAQEEKDLEREVKKLRDELAGASGGRKKAIQAELAKVKGEIGSVQKAITSALQSEKSALQSQVSTLQSTVSSAWSSVQSAIISQFEANTQSMIDGIGKQFFQGGLLTPEEQRYQQMQADDTVKGLQDALAQAQATGDQTQIAAAQHQIDLYNAQQAAEASRLKADQDYADAVAKLTKQREDEEEHLTVALDKFGNGLQDGTNTLSDLQPLLDKYGVNVGDLTDASFILKTTMDDLHDSVKTLDGALQDLADLIGEITGKKPKKGGKGGGGKGGGGSSGGGSSGGGGTSGGVNTVGAFASGGIIPGPMIGPEDTLMARVSTGEAVLSRDELRMLVMAASGATRSPSGGVRSAPIIVLGATEHQVGMALERIVTPAQGRRVGFQRYPS